MFKLSIECTKDIDAVNITFSNGKVASIAPNPKSPTLPLPEDYTMAPDAVKTPVSLPEVPEVSGRDVNIANNLQNLDI